MNPRWKVLLAVLFLTGCVTPLTSEQQAAIDTPLMCNGEKQCRLYWQKVQAWIALNSELRIRESDDTVIATQHPHKDSATAGFKVVKVPRDNNRYEIIVEVICLNMFGCIPDASAQLAELKEYIRS